MAHFKDSNLTYKLPVELEQINGTRFQPLAPFLDVILHNLLRDGQGVKNTILCGSKDQLFLRVCTPELTLTKVSTSETGPYSKSSYKQYFSIAVVVGHVKGRVSLLNKDRKLLENLGPRCNPPRRAGELPQS